MIWNAQPHRVLSARDDIGHTGGTVQDQRERTRPIMPSEAPGGGRDILGPTNELAGIRDMDDQRMVGGPALCREDAGHGRWIFRVRPEAVNGLGGKGDQSAAAQDLCGFRYDIERLSDRRHGSGAPACRGLR